MDDTFFYVAGGVLIVVALVLSLVGMRSDNFPSGRFLPVGIVLVALLVGATAYGAVELSQSEEADRLEEANTEGNVESDQQDVVNQDVGDTEDPSQANGGAGPKDSVDEDQEKSSDSKLDGATVFVDTGCGSCHSLAELGGDAQGAIGPNLDEALADKDEEFIQTSIEDPSAFVETGYPDGTMPQDYKDQLTPAQITALVTFLHEATAGANN